jgi:hypothetical protein
MASFSESSRRSTGKGAGCCALFAALLSVQASLTPYLLWSRYSATTGNAFATSTFYVTSLYTTAPGYSRVFDSYAWAYSSLDDSACSTSVSVNASASGVLAGATSDNYNTWGERYGFCVDGPDGAVRTPQAVVVMQAFVVLTALLSLLTSVLACSGPECRKASMATALSGSISALVFVAQAGAYVFYKDLIAGQGFSPVRVTTSAGELVFTGLPVTQGMRWGPTFMAMVASIIILLGAFAVQLRAKPVTWPEQQPQPYGEGYSASDNTDVARGKISPV